MIAGTGRDTTWLSVLAVLLTLLIPTCAAACSLILCASGGLEVRREFIVAVTHDGKPLPGARIIVTTDGTQGVVAS